MSINLETDFDDRMSADTHVGLLDHLQQTMQPEDCDGTCDRTTEWLITHDVDVDPALDWLSDHGAACDCEVVLNTHPLFSAPPVH